MAEHNVSLELWYDGDWHPAPILQRDGASTMRGTETPSFDTDPGSGTATIDNVSGLYAPRSAASALHGKIGQNTKGRLSIDGAVQLTGEMSWAPDRPVKGPGWTDIQLAGVLQRIGRGTDPRSAVNRATLALSPRAYWPLENGLGAVTDGTPPLVTNPSRTIVWADSDLMPGSYPIPRVATKDEALPLGSGWPFPTALAGSAGGASATAWSIGCWVVAVPHSTAPGVASVTYALQWGGFPVGTTERAWELTIASGTGWTGATEVFVNLDNTNYARRAVGEIMDGLPHHLMVTAEQVSASNVMITLYVDGIAYTTGTGANPANPFTLVPVSFVSVGGESESNGSPDQWMGHVAVFDRVLTADEVGSLYLAGLGYPDERAADRFLRFCVEENIPGTLIGDAGESVVMGPQLPMPRLDILDEIARTDDASIFETRDDVGLTMRTGASKMNQDVALTVSYLGQITPPLRPVFGDVGIRNDVTARNPDGTTRRVVQETGPHNVELPEDDPQGVGRYATTLEVNAATEDILEGAAGWRVHLGTFDGTWYASVEINLDAPAGIALPVTAVDVIDIGDLIEITDLPIEDTTGAYRGIVIGIENNAPSKQRTVTFYLAPAEPYRVGVLADASGDTDPHIGRWAETSDTSSLTVLPVDPGAPSFLVRTGFGPLWTQETDDFPLDVIMAGQQVSIEEIDWPVSDSFGRTAASSWGSEPTSGVAYVLGGSAGDYAVGSGVGTMALASANVFRSAELPFVTSHKTVIFQAALNVASAAGGSITQWFCGRYFDGSNYWVARLDLSTGGNVQLNIFKRVAGSLSSSLGSAGVLGTGHASGEFWWVRVDDFGDNHSARAWKGNYADMPADPQIVVNGDSDVPAGTSLAVLIRREAANTDSGAVASVDNIRVINPQRFAVDSAGLQVVYPLGDSAGVTVADPVILVA